MSFIRGTNNLLCAGYKPLQNITTIHEAKRFSGIRVFLKNGLSTFFSKKEERRLESFEEIKERIRIQEGCPKNPVILSEKEFINYLQNWVNPIQKNCQSQTPIEREKEIIQLPQSSQIQNEITPESATETREEKERISIQNWINQAEGTPEYAGRIEAGKRMLTTKKRIYFLHARSREGRYLYDLNLSNLGLTSVSGLDFSSFDSVNLNNNRITSLKGAIFDNCETRVPEGVILSARNNLITDIRGMDFSSLRAVFLDHNKITSLEGVIFPSGSFRFENNPIR